MTTKPLFIFEMANNHMGDVKHGLKIIREFAKVKDGFDFNFAFKFQSRHIPTFIHPEASDKIKYVKRFTETALSKEDFRVLRNEAEKLGFLTICTPFDEKSVDMIEELNFSGIKIGSCSVPDWPLLERIAKTNVPIIASTAGVSLEDLDNVVNFFGNRNKVLVLMHCVGEYPTPAENLQLNQIDLLMERYPGVAIGFSSHAHPDNFEAVKLALAKGVGSFEKHVQLRKVNGYSINPEQALEWLKSAQEAFEMCGSIGERVTSDGDLGKFKRGVFAKRKIKKGELIEPKDIYFAFPNEEGQLLANNMSKYVQLYAEATIEKNAPIVDVTMEDVRDEIYAIVEKADKILKKNKVPVPSGKTDVSVSYHYGLDEFYKTGAVLITHINREYCKKIIVMFAGQGLPYHKHKKKEETFHFLAGDWTIELEGEEKAYKPGDILTVERGVGHIIKAKTDGVLEEVSSTHYPDDSYYKDPKIIKNKNRRTNLTYWIIGELT